MLSPLEGYSHVLDLLGPDNVYPAEEVLGAAIWKALESANETLGKYEEE